MIKRVRDSLTIKICVLMAVLLLASSGITYAAIVRFLPTYYSSQLQRDLDELSQGMIETIQSYPTISEASNAIELFEAGSHVSVVILGEQGEQAWPLVEAAVTEGQVEMDSGLVQEIQISGCMESADGSILAGDDMEFPFENESDGGEITASSESEPVGAGTASSSGSAIPDDEASPLAGGVPEYGFVQEDGSGIQTGAAFYEDTQISADAVTSVMEAYEDNSTVKVYRFRLGETDYQMLVFGGMQPVNQALGILREIFPYILIISVLAAVIFSICSSVYLTMPIVKLSRVSKRMAALDFGSSYQGRRTDEIGALGTDLNELSGNLSHTLEELRTANAKLKSDIDRERELEKKRIAFFSAVSHELKTPITILKGHLSGMLQGVGEYRNREYYLQRSSETAEKMEELVGELLTVSRIESQTFRTQTTDLAELFRQKLADMTELIENRKLGLEVTMPEHLYAEVNPGMLEKVFSNLLMNAVRYTPEGNGNEIRVVLRYAKSGSRAEERGAAGSSMEESDVPGSRIEESDVPGSPIEESDVPGSCAEESDVSRSRAEESGVSEGCTMGRDSSGNHTVECQVENTGVHIPEEALPHLFDAFYRAEQSRNRNTGGSGLGLYIVRMILEQYGASYCIENTSDGVRFFFTLIRAADENYTQTT